MRAEIFYQQLLKHGLGPFTGVPCALLHALIDAADRSDPSTYIIASSEGEAMGLAAGYALAGRRPVVIMQNDGFGNAVNPLTSLQQLYRLPALLIITWRAQPGGKPDAPQHWIMGTKLLDLLQVLEIPTTVLEDDETATDAALAAAGAAMDESGTSAALVVRRGLFEAGPPPAPPDESQPLRHDYIAALAGSVDERALVLGTTGYTGRELRQAMHRAGSFYTAGSMGCIGSVGLALAREQPNRRVYVLDGDGALLMKMGTLATIGLYRPANLVHIVFDNGQYESTGGQPTASRAVNFPGLAENSGYTYATSVDTLDEFHRFLARARSQDGPLMCHVRVQPGTPPDLPRPHQSPEELRDELRGFLTE